MRKVSSLVTNFDPADSSFTEGKFRNNPGDDTGSQATAEIVNDLYYGFVSMIEKYLGDVNDVAESVTTSDVLDVVETIAGRKGFDAHEVGYDYEAGNIVLVSSVYYRATRDIDVGSDGTTFAAQLGVGAWERIDKLLSDRVDDIEPEIIADPGNLLTFTWQTKRYVITGTYSNGPSGLTGDAIVDATIKNSTNTELFIRPLAAADNREWINKEIAGTWDGWSRSDVGSVIISQTKQVPVRQTALTGPVDANGKASFITAGTGLQAVSTGISVSVPLIIAFGDGFDETGEVNYVATRTTNLTWNTLTANSTLYLYVDLDTGAGTLTEGFTTVHPDYDYAKPSAPSTDEFWYPVDHRSRGEYWTGSVWTPVVRCLLGQVTTNASAITESRTYAYQGKAREQTSLPALGGQVNFNHNIGTTVLSRRVDLINVITEHGYPVGSIVDNAVESVTGVTRVFPLNSTVAGVNSITKTRSNAATYIQTSTGSEAVLTAANWNYIFSIERAF